MKRKPSRHVAAVLLGLLATLCVALVGGAPVNALEPAIPYELGPLNPDILEELQGLGWNLDLLVDDPIVEDINPNGGLTSGGTAVIIAGLKFTGATAVTFGGTAATSFVVNSDTEIAATAPAHAAGSVQVRVTTSKGSSPDTSADDFTYVAAPPTSAAPSTAPPTTAQPGTTAAPEMTTEPVSTTLAPETNGGELSSGWIAFIAVVAVIVLAGAGTVVYRMGKKNSKS